MGVREQNNRKKVLLGEDGNALITLITINIVIFILVNFILMVYNLTNLKEAAFTKNVWLWFVEPADLDKWATRPWTTLTYMFSHLKVMSVISNMLWLWWFGYILQDLTGNRKLGPIYVYGGLAGGVVFIASMYIFPALYNQITLMDPLVGAGASIMAIAVATTTIAPDYRIFPMINGGIPLWILTMVFVLIEFAMVAGGGPNALGGGFAHLAGAGMGFLYAKRLRKGHDMGEWMQNVYHWAFHVLDPKEKKQQRERIRTEVFYETKGKQPFKKTPNVTQQKIDEILDKIGKDGYHFLTDDEKEYLKRASKDL